jgi:predicted acylesterase/phospholipase RssA
MYMRKLPPCISLLLSLALGCAVPHATPPPDVDRLSLGAELAAIRSNFPGTIVQLIDSPQSPVDPQPGASCRNILVLSAGGKDGAFSAGVLVGWSAAGTRPTFDVVTGISTGALIAPMAFLGQRYDRLLTDSFTTVRTEDIYRRRPWMAVLWSDSLADSEPLRRRIDEQVTDGMLTEIARAHLEGRRLYVGTTNLATGRLIVWDMGAIAAGSDPKKRELFQKVILASCSIPGLFPAVPIEIEVDGRRYTELHADGGISSSMFLHPLMVIGKDGGTKANVYTIVAGKLSSESRYVYRRFISVFDASVQELLESRTRSDLLRVFLLSRLTGGRFAVASIPQEQRVDPDATRFDPEEMKRLFEAGYDRAVIGWRSTPPGVNPEEWLLPRTGTHFKLSSERSFTTE